MAYRCSFITIMRTCQIPKDSISNHKFWKLSNKSITVEFNLKFHKRKKPHFLDLNDCRSDIWMSIRFALFRLHCAYQLSAKNVPHSTMRIIDFLASGLHWSLSDLWSVQLCLGSNWILSIERKNSPELSIGYLCACADRYLASLTYEIQWILVERNSYKSQRNAGKNYINSSIIQSWTVIV